MDLFSHVNSLGKKYNITVNKTFNTIAPITSRTLEIASAFGLGIDNNIEFEIYNNFQFGFNEGDVVYITGDSGSGKSILINEIIKKLPKDSYLCEKDLQIDDNEILIESIGKDLNEAIKIMNICGLGEAFLYLRKYNQLSDGQKLRYKLCKMIDSGKEIFIIDEYCGQLDRDTAKIISFNFQKYCRRNKKIFIAASTHPDLKEDLSPNIYIFKKFNNDISVEYNDKVNDKCSIVKNLEVRKVDSLKEIADIERFHYKGKVVQYKGLFGLYLNNDLIGCLVIGNPMLNLKGRNIYTKGLFSKNTSDIAKQINKEFDVISRVVIHPKYRAIGLSYYLIKEYIEKHCKAKFVESLAKMGKYSRFFERAGLTRVDIPEEMQDKKYLEDLQKIIDLGFDKDMIRSWRYVKEVYETLSEDKRKEFDEIYQKFLRNYKSTHGGSVSDIIAIKLQGNDNFYKRFSKLLRTDPTYYIYDNSDNYKENKLF